MRISLSNLLPFALLLFSLEGLSAQKPTRMLAPGGEAPSGPVNAPEISADGTVIVFDSGSTNLISNDQNGSTNDAFLYEIESQSFELISVSSAGEQASAFSGSPVCSGDGSLVAFWSFASNLHPDDPSSDADVFLRDRSTGETHLVSGGISGSATAQFPYISRNGEWVVFESDGAHDPIDTNGLKDVYVYEVASAKLTLVSLTNAGKLSSASCSGPTISDTGKLVSFRSSDSKMAAVDNNGVADVFLRNLAAGTTTIAAAPMKSSLGSSGGWISADGELLLFSSESPELVNGDTNEERDVFIQDLVTGDVSLVSRSTSGAIGNDRSYTPRLSGNQRFLIFKSDATNLAPVSSSTSNLFRRDLLTEETTLVNVASDGSAGDEGTHDHGAIDDSGELVAFASYSKNLTPDDEGGTLDAFIADYTPSSTVYCDAKLNSLGCLPRIGAMGTPSMSGASSFHVLATNVRNKRGGLFFYGVLGATNVPFLGGTLCVQPPLRRTAIQFSGGTAVGQDCTGSYDFDFNAWLLAGSDPNVSLGAEINGQYWSRDPQSSSGIGLTDAVRFLICP